MFDIQQSLFVHDICTATAKHRSTGRRRRQRRPLRTARARQYPKAQNNLRHRDENRDDDEHDDNPRLPRYLAVGHAIRQHFGEVEEDATALVEHLNARFDLEILAQRGVEWVKGWLGVPEEIGDVEDV